MKTKTFLIAAIFCGLFQQASSSAMIEQPNFSPDDQHMPMEIATADSSRHSTVIDSLELVHGYTADQVQGNFAQAFFSAKINRIIQKCPSLKRGISAMRNIYDCGIPEGNYDFQDNKCLRRLFFGGQAAVFAASEIVKCLCLLNPNNDLYGKLLMGLYAAKASIWTYTNHLERGDSALARGIMIDFSTKDEENSNISEYFNTDISKTIKSVKKLSNIMIGNLKNQNLEQSDAAKLNRLIFLNKELGKESILKKIFLYGGKVVSTVMNFATASSIVFTGQSSVPSYWLVLTSSTVDSFFEDIEKYFDKKPASQTYMLASEMLFLCDYLSGKITKNEEA